MLLFLPRRELRAERLPFSHFLIHFCLITLEGTLARDHPSLPSGDVGAVLCGVFSPCFCLAVSLFMHLFRVYFLSMELCMVELSLQTKHLFLPPLNIHEPLDLPSLLFFSW